MVKPKFQMKIRRTSYHIQGKPNSKAEAIVKRKNIDEKEKQIQATVNWCKENGKKGYAALQTGNFPLIKDRGTIDRRLIKNINCKKEHSRILAPEEEQLVVEFIKNKNRCHQGISRNYVTKLILDLLQIHNHCNEKVGGGRQYLKLNVNAKRALENGKEVSLGQKSDK